MEKAGTPSNRLTRSSARNTPSRKTEDSSDTNTAEELKTNLRKSRRKTDTNLRTNGDTPADVDSKKSRYYEEVSDCNSMDSMDSDKSSKQKASPKPKNHKTPSPTISRKSLRTRRSVTPGPEVETNVTRKIRRSTSELSLDSALKNTPTRRHTRAKSESKDFVFTPTKQYSNTEQSHPEANSKCIPVNSALRVIDEIIEEDNELESHKSPKTSPSKLSTIEVGNADSVPLVDTNHENNKTVQEDKIILEKNNSEECLSENESKKSDCLKGNHAVSKSESQELQKDKADITPSKDINNKQSDLLPIVDTDTQADTSKQFTPMENTEVETDSMNQEVCSLKDDSKKCSIPEDAELPNKSSNHLSVDENVDSDNEVSFGLPISKEAEHLKIINIESLNEKNGATYSHNEQNSRSFEEINQSPNIVLCENDKCLSGGSLLQNNQTDILNTSGQVKDKESVCEDSTQESLQSQNAPPASENISITENNNVSMITEVQSESFKVCNEESITTEVINTASLSSPKKDLKSLGSKASGIDKIEDDVTVVICGSDSEEPDDLKGNTVFVETETEGDCEDETQIVVNDSKQVDANAIQKLAKQVTDTGINENNSFMIESVENVEEQGLILEESNTVISEEVQDLNKSGVKSPIKTFTQLVQSNGNTFEQVECTEVSITDSQQNCSELETPISDDLKQLSDILDEDENLKTHKKSPTKDTNENCSDILNLDKENDDNLKEKDETKPSEDEEVASRDSASDSELYKDMSDFGSDVDEKKDGSQYGDSASSELKSGDSEEYASSFEGEEDEENNEENLISNEQETVENIQKKIDPKVAEKLFDTDTPMTYDVALALVNQNRVKKIDDEEFFDLFTQELNRVSDPDGSGSDSDIAIVDEYIAEPEEQQQKKSNQKQGNPQANLKNQQQSLPSKSLQNRAMPTQQGPKQIKINLKTSQKSDFPPNPQTLSESYVQQVPTDHSQRMHFSQGGVYHQYNPGMQVLDPNRGHVMYDQFTPPNMQDPRMFHSQQTSHDNFARGGMYSHPIGQVPDDQMHYSSGSLKVRSIESIHQSNFMNLNSANCNRPVPINHISNPGNDSNVNMMGISMATMTETNDPLNQGVSYSSSSKQTGSITNPILEILGLDKKRLQMLKKVLGLNESRVKQRNKIKQILIEEAQKMGLSLKSTANIENRIARQQQDSAQYEAKTKSRKKQFMKRIIESDSSLVKNLVESSSEHSSEESDTDSEGTSSNISRKDESQGKDRKINIEDGSVSVTIGARQRKQRHRAHQKYPRNVVSTSTSNERKRVYQSSESSDEEHIIQTNKKKQTESDMLIRPRNRESKNRQRRKMTKGKMQTKEKTTVLQAKSGTFTVDPVTASSQSESDNISQDEETNYLEKLKENIKKDLAEGRNKLSNMFTQHSLGEKIGKTVKKRKAYMAFELSEQEPKSRRLPAELLAKLGSEEKKTKKRKKDKSADSDNEQLDNHSRKQRKRVHSKKMNVQSVAVDKEYIPLAVPGSTQFGLKRLDKDGTLTAVEKAAQFRSDRLYGSAVKRITNRELLCMKKKQHRNDLLLEKKKKKKTGVKSN